MTDDHPEVGHDPCDPWPRMLTWSGWRPVNTPVPPNTNYTIIDPPHELTAPQS